MPEVKLSTLELSSLDGVDELTAEIGASLKNPFRMAVYRNSLDQYCREQSLADDRTRAAFDQLAKAIDPDRPQRMTGLELVGLMVVAFEFGKEVGKTIAAAMRDGGRDMQRDLEEGRIPSVDLAQAFALLPVAVARDDYRLLARTAAGAAVSADSDLKERLRNLGDEAATKYLNLDDTRFGPLIIVIALGAAFAAGVVCGYIQESKGAE